MRNSREHYGPVAQGLHWLTMLLVVLQIYLAVAAFGADEPTREAQLLALHRPLGISLLALMVARLGWRLIHVVPPAPRSVGRPLRILARTTHWLLYGLLISIPLVGWIKAADCSG